MKIQVNTDSNIDGNDELTQRVEAEFETVLSRFGDRLTRVEVHLRDDVAGRSDGTDIRCLVEARPARQQPVAVTHHAATPEEAYSGAAQKLKNLLESSFGRLGDHKGAESIRHKEVREELL